MLQTHSIYQLKWLLGILFVLAGIGGLLLVDFLAFGLLLYGLLVMVLVGIFPVKTYHYCRSSTKGFLCFLGIYWLLFFLLETITLFNACIHLVICLAVYRAVRPRTCRHDLQLLLLTMVLIVSAGVLSLSLFFALQVLVLTPLALWYLFIIHLYDGRCLEDHAQDSWTYFSWKKLCSQLIGKTDLRITFLVGSAFIMISVVSASFFLFLPRIDMHLAQDFLNIEGQKRTGFSEQISLSGVTNMVEDETIAFRADPPNDYRFRMVPYWRMVVFDQYHDGNFFTSDSLKKETEQLITQVFPKELANEAIENIDDHWVVWLEGNISRFLPLGGSVRSIRLEKARPFFANPDAGYFHLKKVEPKVTAYLLEDMQGSGVREGSTLDQSLFEIDRSMFSQWSPQNAEIEYPYPATTLEIPLAYEEMQLLQDWVGEIIQGRNLTAIDFSTAAIRFLADRHSYSTASSFEVAGDPVVSWMKARSVGHCEYFAAAFTLLARTAGIPTRIIAGYRGASQNEYEEYMIVRNKQAHAWVEIFDEKGRWIRLDPTPGNDQSLSFVDDGEINNQEVQLLRESGFELWLDSLRMIWYRNIVNFDAKSQEELAESVQEASKEGLQRLKDKFKQYQKWAKEHIAGARANPIRILYGIMMLFLFLCGFILTYYGVRYGINKIFSNQSKEAHIRNIASRHLQMIDKMEQKNHAEEWASICKELQYYRFAKWSESNESAKAALSRIQKQIKNVGRK